MKAFTDLEQSKNLAEFLPLEGADMTLPFRHTQKDEYIPEHVGTRSYIDVYNEMIVLPGMDKEQVCKLIQPCWSLAALLGVLPDSIYDNTDEYSQLEFSKISVAYHDMNDGIKVGSIKDNLLDACYEMIIKLHEQNIL